MTYLIIGASSDMGKALIKQINSYATTSSAPTGSTSDKPLVIAHYRSDASPLESLSSECENITICPLKADLTDEKQVSELISSIESLATEGINKIVFLPAMPLEYIKLKALDLNRLRKQMDISIYSFLEIMRSLLPNMRKLEDSRLVCVLSKVVTEELPPKMMADYVITKYALMGAMKALASEYGNSCLSIVGIAPNMTESKFLDNVDERIKLMTAASMKEGRLLNPEEVASKIYNLLSNKDVTNGSITEI